MKLDDIKSQIFALDDSGFKELFSEERADLFGGQKDYREHLEFCQEISPYVHLIEVLLRNKIDRVLKKAINTHQSSFTSEEWLFDLLSLDTKNISQKIKASILSEMSKISTVEKELEKQFPLLDTRDQNIKTIILKTSKAREAILNQLDKKSIHSTLISRLNLGTWRNIIAIAHEIDGDFFKNQTNLKQDIFPKLYQDFSSSNSSFSDFFNPVCHSISNHPKLELDRKIVIFVSCITSLRNRMSHWEYLFKYDSNNKIQSHSCIMTRMKVKEINPYEKLKFSLVADKPNIEKYLEKLLEDLIN